MQLAAMPGGQKLRPPVTPLIPPTVLSGPLPTGAPPAGTFTVVHHTAPHIPFKPAEEWNAAKAQLSGTVHCDYPRVRCAGPGQCRAQSWAGEAGGRERGHLNCTSCALFVLCSGTFVRQLWTSYVSCRAVLAPSPEPAAGGFLHFCLQWVEFLCFDINVHVPHHVMSKIPWYNLRAATDSLRQVRRVQPYDVQESRNACAHAAWQGDGKSLQREHAGRRSQGMVGDVAPLGTRLVQLLITILPCSQRLPLPFCPPASAELGRVHD